MSPFNKSKDIADSISRWYFSKKAMPYWCVLLCDCFIVFCSLFLAHLLNNGWNDVLEMPGSLILAILAYLILYIIAFRIFRT